METMDDVNDMVGHLAASTVRPPIADRDSHIGNAQATAVLVVAELRLHRHQVGAVWLAQVQLSAKAVGVDAAQRALAAIDLDCAAARYRTRRR